MNLKMLKNDFKRNPAGNVVLLLFMTLAAGLVVVATIVVTQLLITLSKSRWELINSSHKAI